MDHEVLNLIEISPREVVPLALQIELTYYDNQLNGDAWGIVLSIRALLLES